MERVTRITLSSSERSGGREHLCDGVHNGSPTHCEYGRSECFLSDHRKVLLRSCLSMEESQVVIQRREQSKHFTIGQPEMSEQSLLCHARAPACMRVGSVDHFSPESRTGVFPAP